MPPNQRAPELAIPTIERLYNDDYYQTDCDGHEEYARTQGARLPRRLRKCARLASITADDRVIDVGCGRGELAIESGRRGAQVLAIDPSSSAVHFVAKHPGLPAGVRALRARGEALPIPDSWATLLFLTDIVEHLPPPDLEATLRECRRVLAPRGRMIVHTQPNRILVDWTVPLLSRISWSWGVKLPRDLRLEMTPGSRKPYHVNEQSLRQLRRALLHAGLELEESWLEGSYPLHRIFGEGRLKRWLMPRFRTSHHLKNCFASQLFAVCRGKPSTDPSGVPHRDSTSHR